MNSFLEPSVQDVMKCIKAKCIELIVYKPMQAGSDYFTSKEVNDLADSKQRDDVIVANRRTETLADLSHKGYARDLFGGDL